MRMMPTCFRSDAAAVAVACSPLMAHDSNAPSQKSRSRLLGFTRVFEAHSESREIWGLPKQASAPAVRDVEGCRLMLVMLGPWGTRRGGAAVNHTEMQTSITSLMVLW